MDISTLPTDAILVALVAITVQLLKPFVELALPADAAEHDPIIRLLAVLLGIGLVLVARGTPADGAGAVALLGSGLGTGLAAIGGYHALTGSATPAVHIATDVPPGKVSP